MIGSRDAKKSKILLIGGTRPLATSVVTTATYVILSCDNRIM